ncbi:hypothetical protein FSP39_004241 [Pinctada imbricata]|uniref:YqaJ viral recombinase domain-containing protein n=1 Tax=Pinctada imbricata TaxID=66713 RepID=A0AA88XHL0_PINIB|nr:hypothetical protein FSP39_004241 [Pinctada imbricata]
MTRKKSRLDQRTKRKRTVQLIPSPKRQRIEDVEPQGHENYDEILEPIDINILLSNVLEKLEKVDCKKDFLAFLQCVADDEFPLDNISFLLFLDTVRFYSSMNTKQMRYRQQTKAFWNAGQRLFHNKFLYFMSGPKNVGQLLEPTSELLSKNSGINFAVPDLKILSSFQENVFQVPKTLNTGCLSHILDKIQPCNGDSYMLCADAKKVTTGLDAKGGDVDFFGFEEGVTLEKRISRFEEENRLIREIKINAAEIKKSPNGLQNIILILSTRIQKCRDLKNRQEYGLQKFLNLGGTNWRDSKYVYAISSLQASLYQIRQFIKNALDEISNICRILSGLKSPLCEFESQVVVDATFKTNMLRLIDNQIIPGPTEPRFIKQRSDYWHKIRKSSRVTGSSIYNAIGLRGLKQQQAHYDEHIDGKIQLISTELEQRFRHGTDNEMHAVATVVGSILPIYFPNSCYVEEGCYLKYGLNVDQALLEVSPDGSIRDVHYSSVDGSIERIGKCLAAVEVKCPFPNGNEANVHHVLPDYYVAQCLAEMHVMETSRLIFVSYTANSSAVFDVTFDLELWMTIWNKISEIYDKDALQRPTKLTENVKSMKERMTEFTKSNVKFLGEYRSHRFHDQGLCVKSSTYPFLHGLEKERIVSSITQDEINYSMDTSSSLLNEGYNLLRKKATEIMVWVLTNKDRNSKLEIPCSVPVAFGLKDYRLSCKAMRQATGKVLAECRKRNIRVDSFAADGQWAQLMLRDGDGKPSTLLQLQKDVWRSVTKHSKQDLIAKISNLNKVQLEVIGDAKSNILLEKDVESGAVVVESTDRAFEAIRTTSRRDCWGKKGKKKKETVVEECEENDIEAQSQKLKDIEWLPNEILQKVTEGGNEELLKAIVRVEGTRTTILKENGETTKHYNPLLENNMEDVRSSIDDEMKETDMNNQEHGNETHRSPTIHHPLILSEESTSMLSNLLSRNSKISKYWNRDNPIDLFSDANTLVVLTHTEIDSVYEILRSEIHAHKPNQPGMRKSWPKLKKCEFLIDSFRQTSCFNAPTKSKRRRATVPKLCTMATKMLRGHQVPKDVIAIAYAQYVFYEERRNWYDSSPIKNGLQLHGFEDEIPFWYSLPEYNEHTESVMTKSIDCSHNFTHLRIRTATTGICGVNSKAWHECAKSNSTNLNISMVADLLDKQSVANARTHFSENVENWMWEHGFTNSAELTGMIRRWYEASDSPSIPVEKRIHDLLQFRNFLLDGVHFEEFPPAMRYIKGIPIVTYEGILLDIDSKLQLYGISGPYNIRSVGSLAAETTVGILQSLNSTSQVSIKAIDVPRLMSTAVQVMTYKLNPTRGFWMRTSRQSGIYPDYEASSESSSSYTKGGYNAVSEIPSHVIPRNHAFDVQRQLSRHIKVASVSGPSCPSRGALPVRQWHRTDESKILPMKRLGIDD